jgi:uroporphyrinogen III methyltransferase/synthase
MENNGKGLCVLAGAGPGDLGLVTLRTKQAVEQADVVIYDYLSNPDIIRWAPPHAEVIYAGKQAGCHTLTQQEINDLLVEKTRQGKLVVRLKGGDPFVFGRGGEEAEALAAAGLRFEIVPGVSSAIAVPAYAGIPVTHRQITSNFTVFTGHEDPSKSETSIDYKALIQGGGTLVMLMGMERLEAVIENLRRNGAAPDLPIALIRWGTTGRQQTHVGTIGTIAATAQGFEPPAVVVIGDVVRLRERLGWFENRPLFGKRVVVTRTRKQASALSARLRLFGAEVWELPTIRIEPPKDLLEFGELVRDVYQYDWVIFTSPNGVEAFFDLFFRMYKDAREIGNVRIAAIGPATAQKVKQYHLSVDLQPQEFVAEAVLAELLEHGSVENLRILLARAEGARDVLPKRLSELGAIVDEAIAYRTVPETDNLSGVLERFRNEGADIITFTSSSTVENYLALKLPWPANLKTASIGPVTSKTMREHGLAVDAEAIRYDIDGLVAAILERFGR